MAKTVSYLWGKTKLPKWDSAEFYRLWEVHAFGAPTPFDRDRLSKFLMLIIAADFARQNWIVRLKRVNLDADDVAAEVLCHVYKKLPEVRLSKPHKNVLTAFVHRMIWNKVATLARNSKEPLDESQTRGEDGESDWLGNVGAMEGASVSKLRRVMELAEEDVLRGVPGDIFAIQTLYRYLRLCLIYSNTVIPHRFLPSRLKSRVSETQHAIIGMRINMIVEHAAASGEVNSWE